MAADIILKNAKSRYFGNGLTDRYIWHDDAYWPFASDWQLKFWTFKNPRWYLFSYILANPYTSHIFSCLLRT